MKETIYSKATLEAVRLITEQRLSPQDAWSEAIKLYTDSKSSQNKSCPKGAFLGLCEEGYIKGVPSGKYTKSIDNKRYALKAIKLLRADPKVTEDKLKLWKMSCGLETKKHNSQMDVVITLWKNMLIV